MQIPDIDCKRMIIKHWTFYKFLGLVLACLGALALWLWLSLQPETITCNVLFISAEQPLGQNENGTIVYALQIENPNMDSTVYYRSTSLSFLYGQNQDKVADTTIGSFHQGIRSKHYERGTVNAKPGALKNFLADAIANKKFDLKVALMTRLRYKTWGIKSRFHGINLKGVLPIGADGKLMLSGKKKKYKLKQGSKGFFRSVKGRKKLQT